MLRNTKVWHKIITCVILRDKHYSYMQYNCVFRQVLESCDSIRGTDATVTRLPARTESVEHKLYMQNSPPELLDDYILQ
jgi:hypothetical protein